MSVCTMCIYYVEPINTKYKTVIKKSNLANAAVVWLLSHQNDNMFTFHWMAAEDSAISAPGYDTYC